ncbi:MAG: ribokinase [Actinomycetota bacterium]|nr:ribokinase [Actinomycetota bacterium]
MADNDLAGNVLVVGSVHRDITVLTRRLPGPGETLIGDGVVYGLGGKGANQAVAVARSGVPVRLLGSVGDDDEGGRLRTMLGDHGVGLALLRTAPELPTGTAHIIVEDGGENSIIVVQGANASTTPEAIGESATELAAATVVVLQSEIPASSVIAALELLRDAPSQVVVNLAPVVELPNSAWARVDVLVVNGTEAGQVLGAPPPRAVGDARAAAAALARVARASVVTLGPGGAVIAERDGRCLHLTAPVPERVVDTTGAGDALVGVLAAGLAQGASLADAARAAVAAATSTVVSLGAAPSYPLFSPATGEQG